MQQLIVKKINGLQPYLPVWDAMRAYINAREAHPTLPDQIWVLEHESVFTQGQAGKAEHILNPHDIPVVQTDRGGQVTYHGPGQLMIYTLLNLNELALSTRAFVQKLEQCVIDYLQGLSIHAISKREAPGVYIDERKICSIGLRVRKGFTYHGIAFNVDMDLTPFTYINPCGFNTLKMTQLNAHATVTLEQVITHLLPTFFQNFGYNQVQYATATLTELTKHD